MSGNLQELSISVVGAGTMGKGILQTLAQAGFKVQLYDTSQDAVMQAIEFSACMIDRAAAKGRISADQAWKVKAGMKPAKQLEDLASADIVIEAIFEDVGVKHALLAKLDTILAPDAIIASNTSSLSITAIAAGSAHPKRVAGLHFFNPVPLMKVVEVIRAVDTTDEVMETLRQLVLAFGHTPIVTGDSPGFVVNHAGRGLYTEGLRIVQEGVSDTASIDLILRESAGFRMGPFELLDMTGLDVSYPVMRKIYEQFWHEPRFRPSPLPALQVEAGYFGRKTGRGFYSYPDGKIAYPPKAALPAIEADMPEKIWLDNSDYSDASFMADLRPLLGDVVDNGEEPSSSSICLVAPFGLDVSQCALGRGLDPARTLAIDPLFSPDKHLTLMTSPATSRLFRDATLILFDKHNLNVTSIHDSPGFVAQRVIASIINIACDIAQQNIASPTDIDLAVTLGLGYPKGPLSWGDELGAKTVLDILDAIFTRTGDPRYRASLWLRRRAELGLSLLAEEN